MQLEGECTCPEALDEFLVVVYQLFLHVNEARGSGEQVYFEPYFGGEVAEERE